jgi:trehalose synthase
LRPFVAGYDASIYHMEEYAQGLPHRQAVIPPSIDPLSEKNLDLPDEEVTAVYAEFDIDPGRPLIVQVSRFDRFKDPVGVVEAYRIAKRKVALQLVLAGGTATDDPEGAEVLAEVRQKAGDDKDIHLLLLPPDAHRTINALQCAADVVLQKSLREGFGLTVTEAMWKGKPVIGGDAGGIRLQIRDGETGYRVSTVEQCAERIVELLRNPDHARNIADRGREHVRKNFLITRHTRDYLKLAGQLTES